VLDVLRVLGELVGPRAPVSGATSLCSQRGFRRAAWFFPTPDESALPERLQALREMPLAVKLASWVDIDALLRVIVEKASAVVESERTSLCSRGSSGPASTT